MKLALTKKELANVAGYTYRRLYDIDNELAEMDKLFVPASGEDAKSVGTRAAKYDLCVFVRRWVAYNVRRENADAGDLDEVKAQHEKVKTRKTELEVARMEGRLLDAQDVRRLWATVATTIMNNMIHLPSKVAPRLTALKNADEIAAIIDKEVREILNGIADTPMPEYAAPEQGAEDEGVDSEDDAAEDEEDAGEV